MATKIISRKTISVDDLDITLLRKRIQNLHLRIHPENAQVTVSAPIQLSEQDVHEFISKHLEWIKKHKKKFTSESAAKASSDIHNNKCYILGKPFTLKVIEQSYSNRVIEGYDCLIIYSKSGISTEKKQQLLENWRRQKIKEIIPDLIKKYERIMSVNVLNFGVKRMKTRWGTCNPAAKRIWLNLELIKFPVECLECVIVHEMVHLFEQHHNTHFYKLMDKFMPMWKAHDQILHDNKYL